MKILFPLLTSILFLTSCASLSHYPGIGRTRKYTFEHPQVPQAFDGFRIAFVSDIHYPSKFKRKHLHNLVRALRDLQPDLLLLGGDYQEGCEYVEELFTELGRVHPPYGTAGVLGNNDYERCTEQIRECMKRHQIRVLEHRNDTVWRDSSFIIVSGVRNPFDLKANGISPTLALHDSDFVILLTHTPDYVEDVPVPHTDLALAGHTHGGQVSFFRLWTPQTGSKYGSRLLTGRRTDSHGLPVIITNGLGTSRLPVRFCSPSEIVEITLKREYSDNRNGL
mgnify:FL=1